MISTAILVVVTAVFLWAVNLIIKRAGSRAYQGLAPEDHDAKTVLLAPGRIATTGTVLMVVGILGCGGAIVMLAQNFDYQISLFWAALVLILLMLGMICYGRHLYLIRDSVVQLYLGIYGLYHPDLKITTARRPFWAILENKKFVYRSYLSIEAVKVVSHFTGGYIVIETSTGGFTLPFYGDAEQELIKLADIIKHKVGLR